MKLFHATRNIVGWIAVVFCASVLLVVAYGVLTDSWRMVPVLSGSMEPAVNTGDVAVAFSKPVENVAVGDVIVYTPPTGGALIMHRVIELVGEENGQPIVRTQGDSNNTPDPWSAQLEGQTIWEVERRVPVAGYPVLWMDQGPARIGLVVAATIFMLWVALSWIWKDKETSNDIEPEVVKDANLSL